MYTTEATKTKATAAGSINQLIYCLDEGIYAPVIEKCLLHHHWEIRVRTTYTVCPKMIVLDPSVEGEYGQFDINI